MWKLRGVLEILDNNSKLQNPWTIRISEFITFTVADF